MGFLNRVPIQRQLAFLAIFVAVGMIGLAITSRVINDNVRQLADARLKISRIDAGMLRLRRNEKDFMTRKDTKYIDRFAANYAALQADVDRLEQLLAGQSVEFGQVGTLRKVFSSYQATFLQVAVTLDEIGLDHESGLYGALRQAVHRAEAILEQQEQVRLTVDMLMLRRREKDFMLRFDPKYVDKFEKDYAVFMQHLADSRLDAVTRAEVVAAMQGYRRDFLALVEGFRMLGLSSSEGQHGAMRTIIHQSETLLREFEDRTRSLIDERALRLVTLHYLVGALLVLLVLGLIGLLIKSILSPVREMARLMLETSENWDLRASANEQVPTEIADMARAFNAMMAAFRDMVRNVKTSSARLNESSGNLAEVTKAMDQGVKRQQLETSQLASAMDEMSGAVQDVASNAATAAEAAVSADEDGKRGLEVIEKAQQGISALAAEFSDTANIVSDLSTESENIGTVLNVIRNIAEQTNLLALNAAIEAARAGEQGRGFAVVADEVRTLAQRSQESTEEIQTIVERLQQTAESAVAAMARGQDGTARNVEQSHEAATMLSSIIDAITRIKDMNLAIATASEEQAAVSTEINKSVKNINDVTNETAKSSLQTMQAGEAINEISTGMQRLVETFRVE